MRLALIALVAALTASPALAQEHGASGLHSDGCGPAGGHGGLEWRGGDHHGAVARACGARPLALGKGYAAALKKKGDVTFSVEPEKPGGSVSYSGLFSFTIPEAGNYAVALGAAAWIDVLEDGKALEPASFGHGPECTTMRKKVVFALKPGLHVLQVAGNGAETLKLMVAKAS